MVAMLLRKTRSALRMSLREKLWLILLYPLSGLFRAAILTLPMRATHWYYGQHYKKYQLCPVVSEQQRVTVCRIGRVCELTAKYTPWESKCLVQALMAKTLLQLYGIPYVMHLGVTPPKANQEMKAHAWVMVGPWIVTGRGGHRAFTIVSTFLSPVLIANNGARS